MGVVLRIDPKMADLLNAFSAENLTKYLTAVGDLELSQTRSRFNQQVDPSGNPWLITKRKIKDPSAKILRKSSVLFNSLASQVVGNSVYIGTNLSYASVHQNGEFVKTKFTTFQMPQRQFIGTNDKTIRNIENAFQATMRSILK